MDARGRKWFDRGNFRNERGNKCANCGNTQFLEMHHVVPLSAGGTNNDGNLILLCHKCHMLAHKYTNVNAIFKGGGRPSKCNPEDFDDFIFCHIGTKEFKRKHQLSDKTHIADMRTYGVRLKELGIEEVKNYIDLHDSREVFSDRYNGKITYLNGTTRYIDNPNYKMVRQP